MNKRRKNIDKIANLVANYESENEIEFLKGIASNLHLGSFLKSTGHMISMKI